MPNYFVFYQSFRDVGNASVFRETPIQNMKDVQEIQELLSKNPEVQGRKVILSHWQEFPEPPVVKARKNNNKPTNLI